MSSVLNVFGKARDVIHDLCEGRAKWTMSIPANEETDSDLVLDKALTLGSRLYNLQEEVLEVLHRECASLAWVANMDDSETERANARMSRESLLTLIRSIRAILNEIEGKK